MPGSNGVIVSVGQVMVVVVEVRVVGSMAAEATNIHSREESPLQMASVHLY